MASESSSEQTLSITLPADLNEWLDQQAAGANLDREELLVQLLASYRMTAEQDDPDEIALDSEAIAEAVRAQLDEQLAEATNAVQRQLSNQIDSVEADFDEKIEDIRERVVQIKRETDQKAPNDHSHSTLDAIPELESTLADLEADLAELRTEFDEQVPEHDETITEIDDRLEELTDRLQTVAWVVSDLREASESSGGLQAVERIKRAAAKADIERANCENCGDGVTLSLLTDPECPHCSATVTNVEPASGWFGSPTLVTAKQLESGEQS